MNKGKTLFSKKNPDKGPIRRRQEGISITIAGRFFFARQRFWQLAPWSRTETVLKTSFFLINLFFSSRAPCVRPTIIYGHMKDKVFYHLHTEAVEVLPRNEPKSAYTTFTFFLERFAGPGGANPGSFGVSLILSSLPR
jgi:hypothetical protein